MNSFSHQRSDFGRGGAALAASNGSIHRRWLKDEAVALRTRPRESKEDLPPLPRVSRALTVWFTWYCRRFLGKHFNSLGISNSAPAPCDRSDVPLVVYANHPSWWDPLIGLAVKAEFFPNRELYAPMAAPMLERYRLFSRLGFFGVEQAGRRGVEQFLRMSESILSVPRSMLVLTPQGCFADVRKRPPGFRGGLGRLAAGSRRAVFLPVAIELVFWEERLPEILIRFGDPEDNSVQCLGAKAWTQRLEERLAAAQEALAKEAQTRDRTRFKTILRGRSGVGGVYGFWQRLKVFKRTVKEAREEKR